MKLTFFFLTAAFLQVSAKGLSQTITYSGKNVPLETVFTEIKKQTGFVFFYTSQDISLAKPVTVELKNMPVEEALTKIMTGQPLTHLIRGNTVFIKAKAGSKPIAVIGVVESPPITVKGRITTEAGEPVMASILVKGTKNGTTSNADGYYELREVDEKAILVISGVNIEEQEVRVNSRVTISITARIKASEGEEVVVAYNRISAKSNVGAVTVVKGEEVQNLPSRSFDKSLQGLVPGLLVTSGTGQPGGGMSNFVLRGIATGSDPGALSTVRNPLLVVDGIPVTQDYTPFRDYSINDAPVVNPVAQINPSDIETITVLKDAAAIALYGAKASNGVILITTKQGKAGKAAFSFRHQTDIASRLKGKIELLNQEEYLDLLYETYKNTNPVAWTDAAILADIKSKFPTRADGSFYPMTDWPEEIYTDNAYTFSNDLSVSGGNDRSRYYLNLEYTKQNGTFKKTGYDRKSIRFNFENRPVDWLKLGTQTTLSYNVQDYASLEGGTYPLGISMYFPPLNPARYEDGSLVMNYSFPYAVANPLAAMEYNTKRNTAFRGLSRMFGELTFLKYFKLNSSVGVDFMLLEAREKIDPRVFDYATKTLGGRVQERDTRTANIITTNTLRFDKDIKKDHAVNILLGQEAQIQTTKTLMVSVGNIRNPDFDNIDNGTSVLEARGLVSKQTLLSLFAQGNYGYKSKYFFTASIRKDGSSLFGERNRFGTYWSTGVGWVVSAEPFMQSTSSWLNYLKVRGSIGAAGNAAAINRLTRFDQLLIGAFLNNQAVYPYTSGNPNIKWEETFTWDAGLEARLFNQRIAVTADVYKRKTYNLIYSVFLPPVTGAGSILDNIGDIENTGLELFLTADIIKKSDWGWKINANWSTNRNILVKANIPLVQVYTGTLANEEGRNFNSYYLPLWAGVNPANGSPQWIDSTGKPSSDYNAAKRQWVGKPQPDAFGAVTHTFSYKGIELSAMFYYQYGFKIFNTYNLTADGFQPFQNQDKRALDYWKKPGDIATNPKRTLNNSFGVFSASTRNLYKGDYIRFQTLTLSYRLSPATVRRLGLTAFKIYAQAHNLALWNNFPGGDPGDVNMAGSVNISYPNQRTFSLGVNVNF